jgi:hypothetical protein
LQQLAVVGYTGTVAVGQSLYVPTSPLVANGLTVLVPIAPFEETTAANRRLVADVEAFAPVLRSRRRSRRLLVGGSLRASLADDGSRSPASGCSGP